MEVDRCFLDPEKTARAYLSGTLSDTEAARFEDHFVGCPRCGDRLQFTKHFAIALGHVGERLQGILGALVEQGAEQRPYERSRPNGSTG